MALYEQGRTLIEAIPYPRTKNDNHVHVWETAGLRANYPIGVPENFSVSQTFVISTIQVPFRVALLYKVNENTGILDIGELSSLDELKKMHPQLFEVKGSAYLF